MLSAYKLTVSTRQSLSDEDLKVLESYIKGKCVYSYGVAEFGASDKRHAHYLLICKEPCFKRNLADRVWRIIRQRHEDSCQKYAVRADVLYDHCWYDTYLSKEENRQELFDEYDRTAAEAYFPTPEQQANLKAIAGASDAHDPYYADLELHFREYWKSIHRTGNPSKFDIAQFLNHSMYVAKDMRVISDMRRVDQITRSLYKYVNSDAKIDYEQMRMLKMQDGVILQPHSYTEAQCVFNQA